MAGSGEEQLFIGSSKVENPLSVSSSWSWNELVVGFVLQGCAGSAGAARVSRSEGSAWT